MRGAAEIGYFAEGFSGLPFTCLVAHLFLYWDLANFLTR